MTSGDFLKIDPSFLKNVHQILAFICFQNVYCIKWQFPLNCFNQISVDIHTRWSNIFDDKKMFNLCKISTAILRGSFHHHEFFLRLARGKFLYFHFLFLFATDEQKRNFTHHKFKGIHIAKFSYNFYRFQ